jgi:acyl carrier protein
MQTTYERLRAILVKDYKLDAAQVTLDAPLESLGIDSLGLADLLFTVEDQFLIEVPPEQVVLPTLGDVVNFIDGLIAKHNDSAAQPNTATPEAMQSA